MLVSVGKNKMTKFIVTFECENKFESDMMTFCYEVVQAGHLKYDEQPYYGSAEDCREFLEQLNAWLDPSEFSQEELHLLDLDLDRLSDTLGEYWKEDETK
jgi:hypothetical protein